jgi:hypothetical protein
MAARLAYECGGNIFDAETRLRLDTLTPLYGFRIDLMGFRSPEVGTGRLTGLVVASSSHPTFFRTVPEDWLGDSADEMGLTVDAGFAMRSFEETRSKNEWALDSSLSDSRGGVGGLGAAAGNCRVRDMCARGTMTAISRDGTGKLHRDSSFHPVLLHGSWIQGVDFLRRGAMFLAAYRNATRQRVESTRSRQSHFNRPRDTIFISAVKHRFLNSF